MRVLRTLAAYRVPASRVLVSCFLVIAFQALAQETPASLSDEDEAASYLSAFKQRALDAAFDSQFARVKGVAASTTKAVCTSAQCSPVKPTFAASR